MNRPAAFAPLAMAAVPALLLAACGEPPVRKPALSQAVLDELTAACALPARAISLSGMEVLVAGNHAMSYDQEACILKHVRERLPQAQIRFAGSEDTAAKGKMQ